MPIVSLYRLAHLCDHVAYNAVVERYFYRLIMISLQSVTDFIMPLSKCFLLTKIFLHIVHLLWCFQWAFWGDLDPRWRALQVKYCLPFQKLFIRLMTWGFAKKNVSGLEYPDVMKSFDMTDHDTWQVPGYQGQEVEGDYRSFQLSPHYHKCLVRLAQILYHTTSPLWAVVFFWIRWTPRNSSK